MNVKRSIRFTVLGATLLSLVACGGLVRLGTDTPSPMEPDASGSPRMSAGGGSATGSCDLIGTWYAHSQPWNGLPTDAEVTFNADGTLNGVPVFVGIWSLIGGQLTVSRTTGEDMTCALADAWTLTFSPDCATVPLTPLGSGCTGARRYLHGNITLTRL